MKKIFKLLQKHHKLTTATQIGLDTDLIHILPEYFWSATFIDNKSEWSYKTINQLSIYTNCNSLLYRDIESEVIPDLEYLEYDTDFVYIHNRHSAEFKRVIFNYFLKKKTKFILVHPSVIVGNTNKYKKIILNTAEGAYKLFYIDIIYEELEEHFRRKSNERS
jgi:hypothetical protein